MYCQRIHFLHISESRWIKSCSNQNRSSWSIFFIQCVVVGTIHTPSMKGHWKFQGGTAWASCMFDICLTNLWSMHSKFWQIYKHHYSWAFGPHLVRIGKLKTAVKTVTGHLAYEQYARIRTVCLHCTSCISESAQNITWPKSVFMIELSSFEKFVFKKLHSAKLCFQNKQQTGKLINVSKRYNFQGSI